MTIKSLILHDFLFERSKELSVNDLIGSDLTVTQICPTGDGQSSQPVGIAKLPAVASLVGSDQTYDVAFGGERKLTPLWRKGSAVPIVVILVAVGGYYLLGSGDEEAPAAATE